MSPGQTSPSRTAPAETPSRLPVNPRESTKFDSPHSDIDEVLEKFDGLDLASSATKASPKDSAHDPSPKSRVQSSQLSRVQSNQTSRSRASNLLSRDLGTNNLPAMACERIAAPYMAPELFTGASDQDAKRWFTRLIGNLKRAEITEPDDILREFDSLLSGGPASWASSDPQVKDILHEDYEATAEDVRTIREAFIDYWTDNQEEAPDPIPEIQHLRQGPEETLRQYHYRAATLLRSAGAVDSSDPPSPAVRSILSMAISVQEGNPQRRPPQEAGGPPQPGGRTDPHPP
jgi:hypothetical protein